jgi:starvation-inducible DNA-binding protein
MRLSHPKEGKNMNIDIGISEPNRKAIAEGLERLLADTYTLYLKTHRYHWNVTGPMFQTLHLMFEQHYNELWTATDELAERIRSLGYPAPGSYEAFGKLATVKDSGDNPAAMAMVKDLVEGHEAVVRTARSLFPIASEAGDESTADLATQRLQIHEKTAWMLRSLAAE